MNKEEIYINYNKYKEDLKVTNTEADFARVINAHRDEIIAAAEAANFVDVASYYRSDIASDIAYPIYESDLCNEIQRVRLNDTGWDGYDLYDLEDDRDTFMYKVLELLEEVFAE
jgi:hypothetical protein